MTMGHSMHLVRFKIPMVVQLAGLMEVHRTGGTVHARELRPWVAPQLGPRFWPRNCIDDRDDTRQDKRSTGLQKSSVRRQALVNEALRLLLRSSWGSGREVM